jgi:hypothetical protein
MTNELTVWGDVFSDHLDAVTREVGYRVDVSLLLADPSDVPDEARQAVKDFEAALYGHLYDQLCENIERLRRILAAVMERRERRALAWLRLAGYQELEQVGRALVPVADNSTGRQIEAFWHKHLPELDAAGVDPNLVGDMLAREDKFVVVASHALSRIERSDLSSADKQTAIREIVADAAEMPSAAALGRKWLNGQVQIPRDILTLPDGTRLVTFVCGNDEQFMVLDKVTRHVAGDYGNVEPILVEWMKGHRNENR